MSRRREASELARVLALSTQEARFALDNSPHTLSSPGDTGKRSNTDDSREMEMRPVQPGEGVDPRLLMRPPGSSANNGHPSSSQSQSGTGSGSGEGGRSTIEPVQSTVQRTGISTIQPFTPSAAVQATNPVLVPESSDIQLPNAQQPQPASSVPSSVRAPRVSPTEKSETADPSAPLFSPTQGSRRNMLPQPSDEAQPADESPPRPAVRHQYSRVPPAAPAGSAALAPIPAVTPAVLDKAGSSSRPFQLSSSPDIPTRPQPAAKPVRKSRPVLESSDDDFDPSSKPKSKPSVARRASVAKPGLDDGDRSGRRDSPDPLLIGPSRPASKTVSRQMSVSSALPNDTPTNAKKAAASKAKPKPRTSSAAKGKGKEKEKEKWADNEKEVREDEPEPPKRISSRVKDLQAKEEAEKARLEAEAIERRRKRAEEKERLAREAAAAGGEGSGGPVRPLQSEVIEIEDDDEEVGQERPVEEETRPEARPAETPAVEAESKTADAPASGTSPKVVQRNTTKRKRVLSSSPSPSSPAPIDNIVAIVPAPPAAAAPATTEPTTEVPASAPAARATSVESVYTDKQSEAGPSKAASPIKKPSAKKTKKAAAAAAKKAAASAKKAAPRVVPKSKEMIESDEDKEEVPEEAPRAGSSTQSKKAAAAASKKALADAKKAGWKAVPKSRETIESEEDEGDVPEDNKAGPSLSKAVVEEVPADPSPRKRKSPAKRASPEPSPIRSPAKESTPARPPLTAVPSRVTNGASSSTPRHSPGPMSEKGTPLRPDGIKFKTERNDLATVLSKFPTSRFTGMSRRLKIAPLHSKIGPPKKELPPPPKKAEKRKKGDSDEDEDDEDEEEDEDGVMRKKSKKERGMEWYMVED